MTNHDLIGCDLSVVMPAYREHESIEVVIRSLISQMPCSHEVVVVCDDTNDPTVAVVERLQAEFKCLRLALNTAGGVGRAIASGISCSRGRWVVVMMADGSDDPRSLGPMINAARAGASIVAASRYMRTGSHHGGPGWKRFLSRAAGLTLRHIAAFPVHDVTNNYRLYERGLLEALDVDFSEGFVIAIEATVKAFSTNIAIAEVPTAWRDRRYGESRFRAAKWLPRYARWFGVGLAAGVGRRARARWGLDEQERCGEEKGRKGV